MKKKEKIKKREIRVVTITNGPKISLKELFDNYQCENLFRNFEWIDEPKGREVW